MNDYMGGALPEGFHVMSDEEVRGLQAYFSKWPGGFG